jgi:amicyanin
MKKSVLGGIALILILAGGGLLLANSKDSDSDKNTSADTMKMNDTSSNSKAATNDSATSSDAVATTSVDIKGMAFSPANITVKVGDTVTWTNNDAVAHDVTETDGQNGPKSTLLQPGKSYVFTFDKAGTYNYNCSIHPGMTGSVIVTER